MKKVKCLIVDDENLALDILEQYIRDADFLKLEGRCNTVAQTIDILRRQRIDLVFLDIQMPGISGIQFIRTMKLPPVVFTTAYSNYALEAFEVNALDYLLKPFSYERFLKSIDKFLAQESSFPVLPFDPVSPAFFYVKSQKQTIRIGQQEVLYLESLRNHVIIHQVNGEPIKVLNTIHRISENLPGNDFLRIHRSYIVPVRQICQYNSVSVTVRGKMLPIGRSYRTHVFHVLGQQLML